MYECGKTKTGHCFDEKLNANLLGLKSMHFLLKEYVLVSLGSAVFARILDH